MGLPATANSKHTIEQVKAEFKDWRRTRAKQARRFGMMSGSKPVTECLWLDIQNITQIRRCVISKTPAFLVNGVAIIGAYPPEYFVKVINRLLEDDEVANK